ncbi:hypothetical protein HBI12_228290 [Parastagonospora nodorum]|nr:hypothetical protein HBI12_228290 [Parastagonospora nodorum]KAH5395474.1 hypothetical protein HBI47_232770 [Parastagonospora nodorum]
MCQYHYVYFDKCQHVSFYKVSYCNKAKEFGLPRPHGHSPNANGASDTPGDDFSPASSHPPASFADNSSSSHSHNQHNSHNMSTLTRSGAGATFACNTTSTKGGNHMPQHAALIPRSALQEGRDLNLDDSAALSSSLLNTQRGDLNLPLDHESSLSLAAGHNGSQIDHTRASSMSTLYSYASDADTVRGPSSSRKPIPSQWVPAKNAPTLATAQRAKERGHKPESVSGSPTKANNLRGTRSMADFGRSHAAEGSSFLTKTSHIPLESNLTSPTAGKSPTKYTRGSSKPAWNSPTSSPLRESPRQQPHLIMRTSPVKTELLSAEPTSYGHRRGVSSVTTSTTGESIYHSAESSPVRDTADLTPSFKSTAELPDEHEHTPAVQLHTDIENVQKSRFVHTSVKAATVGRASKPSLRIDIPLVDARTNAGDRSSASYASATNHSATSNSPRSPVSASSNSRIPRVAAIGNASSARGPTRSSTLKRAQSTKSLTSLKTKLQVQGHDSQRQFKTLKTDSPRHVRTVDSSAQEGYTTIEQVESMLRKSNLDEQRDLERTSGYEHIESSRASSISTVKASTAVTDHLAIDPAIIYSKRSTTLGTNLGHPFHVPDIIVMMAHNLELGSLRRNEDQHRTRSASSASRLGSARDAASGRGRTEHLASELRATATEFVPYPANSSSAPEKPGPEKVDISQLDPTTDLLGPVKYELDPYGIPWFYYMYQVQFAFDQGYQKGRSRSPKKTRQKKQYSSSASTADLRIQKAPTMAPALDSYQEQQRISIMPPPVSTVPLAEQRAQQQLSTDTEAIENDGTTPYSPFAAQKAIIDRHFPYRNATVTDRPVPGIDLTTIRNVGLPHGSRPMHQNTMPVRGNNYSNARRNYRSNNGLYTYRGRGAAGLRMADTVPFPAPVAPQGRPAGSNAPGEGCGLVDIIYGAERIGGEACQDCERDHPLD